MKTLCLILLLALICPVAQARPRPQSSPAPVLVHVQSGQRIDIWFEPIHPGPAHWLTALLRRVRLALFPAQP